MGRVPVAGVGSRVLARILDGLLVGIPAALLVVFLLPDFTTVLPSLVVPMVMLPLAAVYETAMIATRGATFGKQVAGIQVVRADTGGQPSALAALARSVALFAVLAVPVVGWLAVPVSTLRDERHGRGWPDRVADTVVVAAGH